MPSNLRIGEQVKIKGTEHKGEIVGVGHNFILWSGTNQDAPTAEPFTCFIVRLQAPFILTTDDKVVRDRAPSAFPGCLFLYEVVYQASDLESI